MRIKHISIAWFRGSASRVDLDLQGKSTIIYGPNGSGKSSFVDALEFAIRDGKINHLTMEASGTRLLKCVPHVGKTTDQIPRIEIGFADDSLHTVQIQGSGQCLKTISETAALQDWDYEKTILRQEEVSRFITKTKGEKYSTLLPLLGLERFEFAAQNLRTLTRTISEKSGILTLKRELENGFAFARSQFENATEDSVTAELNAIRASYGLAVDPETTSLDSCRAILTTIETRIANVEEESGIHSKIVEISQAEFQSDIQLIRSINSQLASAIEPMVEEKISLLNSSVRFTADLEMDQEIDCPVCGRSIEGQHLKDHVNNEITRLMTLRSLIEQKSSSTGKLSSTVATVQRILSDPILGEWISQQPDGGKREIENLSTLNPDTIRTDCDESKLSYIEKAIAVIAPLAKATAEKPLATGSELTKNRDKVKAAQIFYGLKPLQDRIAKIESLTKFLNALEAEVRNELKLQAQSIIDGISSDIQELWTILHSDNRISNIHLYTDGDKGIEIGITFYGHDQPSPRLTLSEGYRNSLGLCIFLSMAKKAESDKPIILDDVVISLDREHRSKIATLLRDHFQDRQIVLFTHDRTWYAELQIFLNDWRFQKLRSYSDLDYGIAFSPTTKSLNEAEALITERPDLACSDARKYMDNVLPILAEKFKIDMPYLIGENNDRRGGYALCINLIKSATKSFKIKDGNTYRIYQEIINEFEKLSQFLLAFGNPGTHTYEGTQAEAKQFLENCEKAISLLTCENCQKYAFYTNNNNRAQCSCGNLMWKFN